MTISVDDVSAACVARPDDGRIYSGVRRVQIGDTSPRGRLRVDSVARYLQDISDEDTSAAGFASDMAWVVRRVVLVVESFPVLRDRVAVTTWCSGLGSRWAERRVTIETVEFENGAGDHRPRGGRVDAVVTWVHLNGAGRPERLPEKFLDVYGPSASGRKASARLRHPAPTSINLGRIDFPVRFTDFDVMGHVNNAVAWEPVEAYLADHRDLRSPLLISMEHTSVIDGDLTVSTEDVAGGANLWMTSSGTTCASARIRTV